MPVTKQIVEMTVMKMKMTVCARMTVTVTVTMKLRLSKEKSSYCVPICVPICSEKENLIHVQQKKNGAQNAGMNKL